MAVLRGCGATYRASSVSDRLSEDEQAAVVAAYAAGEGGASIGRRFGISRNVVLQLADEAGVPRQQRRMTEAEIRTAIRLDEQGRSLASVGQQVGFDLKRSGDNSDRKASFCAIVTASPMKKTCT